VAVYSRAERRGLVCRVTESVRQWLRRKYDVTTAQTKHQSEVLGVENGGQRGVFGGGWVPSGPENRNW
jgi:hypothetical protein